MFEVIDPVYPDAANDERLDPIFKQMDALSEMMQVASEINDARWEGKDATALELRWSQLNKAYMDGGVYEPQF